MNKELKAFVSVGYEWTQVSKSEHDHTPIFGWMKPPTYHRSNVFSVLY